MINVEKRLHRLPIKPTITLLLVLFLLAACQQEEAEPVVEQPTPTPTPLPTAVPGQIEYWQAWQSGPHADTYDLEKGPNTYCAKCHAPVNWDPSATIDEPPNCVSCKFSFETEPRIAEGNPLVPQEEWADIGCEMCHRVGENNRVSPEISWYDTATGFHETVSDSTALCKQCHLDNETLRHERTVSGVHDGFTCTACHDPHSTAADCRECHMVEMAEAAVSNTASIPGHTEAHTQCIDCHTPHNTMGACRECHLIEEADETAVANTTSSNTKRIAASNPDPTPASHPGHTAAHAAVKCVACHDASGAEVGPLEGRDVWVTFRTITLLGRTSTEPFESHQLQLTVDCGRCHFAGNPWDLSENVGQESSEE